MASLKIDIKRLGDEPEDLQLALDSGWFARELDEVVHPESGGQGEAALLVSKTGGKIQVTGQVSARFTVSCGRCLEAAEIVVDEPIVIFFEQASERHLAQDLELTEEDLHWKTFDGDEIDLTPLLRDQLLLGVPMLPLCRPDCEGLTDHLGDPDAWNADAEDRLEIDGKPVDPRWNALAKLKTKR